MEAVNLLPLEYRTRKKKRLQGAEGVDGRRALQMGGAVALLFAVLLAALYVHERSLVHSKQRALADSQARVAAIEPQVNKLKADQAAAVARLSAAQAITSTRMNWDRALSDFGRVVPTNSYLTTLTAAAPVPTASAGAATTGAVSTLNITGVAPSIPGVALVMDRLSLLPWLSGVSLTSAARQGDGTTGFTITAAV